MVGPMYDPASIVRFITTTHMDVSASRDGRPLGEVNIMSDQQGHIACDRHQKALMSMTFIIVGEHFDDAALDLKPHALPLLRV